MVDSGHKNSLHFSEEYAIMSLQAISFYIMDDSQTLKNIEKKLSALVALTALSTFGTAEERSKIKPEIILSNTGLDNSEIAKILGKSLAAIQKTIQRAKK